MPFQLIHEFPQQIMKMHDLVGGICLQGGSVEVMVSSCQNILDEPNVQGIGSWLTDFGPSYAEALPGIRPLWIALGCGGKRIVISEQPRLVDSCVQRDSLR